MREERQQEEIRHRQSARPHIRSMGENTFQRRLRQHHVSRRRHPLLSTTGLLRVQRKHLPRLQLQVYQGRRDGDGQRCRLWHHGEDCLGCEQSKEGRCRTCHLRSRDATRDAAKTTRPSQHQRARRLACRWQISEPQGPDVVPRLWPQ